MTTQQPEAPMTDAVSFLNNVGVCYPLLAGQAMRAIEAITSLRANIVAMTRDRDAHRTLCLQTTQEMVDKLAASNRAREEAEAQVKVLREAIQGVALDLDQDGDVECQFCTGPKVALMQGHAFKHEPSCITLESAPVAEKVVALVDRAALAKFTHDFGFSNNETVTDALFSSGLLKRALTVEEYAAVFGPLRNQYKKHSDLDIGALLHKAQAEVK